MKLLLYCPKEKPYLYDQIGIRNILDKKYKIFNTKQLGLDSLLLNGKIIAECDYEIKDLKYSEELLNKSCLTASEIFNYIKNSNTAYEIHIKNLHIFDKPYKLNDCLNPNNKMCPINKAPQNMQKVWFNKSDEEESQLDNWKLLDYLYEEYVLISIQPQQLCKILNGEKTIEIRKKVLGGML